MPGSIQRFIEYVNMEAYRYSIVLNCSGLGHENPLKSIDFTGPGGGLSPNSPLVNTPLKISKGRGAAKNFVDLKNSIYI